MKPFEGIVLLPESPFMNNKRGDETDNPGCGVTVTAELSTHLVEMCRDTNTASETLDCRRRLRANLLFAFEKRAAIAHPKSHIQ